MAYKAALYAPLDYFNKETSVAIEWVGDWNLHYIWKINRMFYI